MDNQKKIPQIKVITGKSGGHSFDRKQQVSIFDESTWRERNEPSNEYIQNFQYDLQNDIEESDKTRIFILAEYIKRKFYIDLNMKKDGDIFQKTRSGRYIKDEFTTDNCLDHIFIKLSVPKKIALLFNINYRNYDPPKIYRCNTYFDVISDIYKQGYSYFRIIVKRIIDGKIECRKELPGELNNFFKNHYLTPYLFERIIYLFSGSNVFMLSMKSDLGKIAKLLSMVGELYPIIFFSNIHKHIVDKYKMYMYDLIRKNEIYPILESKKDIKIPRFFFCLLNHILTKFLKI